MKLYPTKLFLAMLIALLLLPVMSYSDDFDIEKYKSELPKMLGANNQGKEFWFSFPPCWESPGSNNAVRLYISSAVATVVTVEVPGRNYVRQNITKPNDIIEFELAPDVAQCYRKSDQDPPEPEQIYGGYGVHVYADQPIICYGVTRFHATSDGFLGVPVSSLGKDYIVSSWTDIGTHGSQWLNSYTAITSAYDNNKISFKLGGPAGNETVNGQKVNQTVRWTLYTGDVLLYANGLNFGDLSGSRVTGTKPFSVVSGNFCTYIPENCAYCDFISEMELPSNTWGTTYHVVPFETRLKNSLIRIYSKEANTTIYRDGGAIKTLKTGGGLPDVGWLQIRAEDNDPVPVVISADKPITVTEYNSSQEDDGVTSDPFQLVLTPIEQYQTEIVFNTPGIHGGYGFADNYINICYAGSDDGTIPQDMEFATVESGNFVWKKLSDVSPSSGTPFRTQYNGKTYLAKRMRLPGDGVYRLRANNPFTAYAYGFSTYDSYGFPTSVALGDLEVVDTLPPDPQWTVQCDGNVYHDDDTYVEDMPRDAENRSNMSMIVFDAANSYNYEFDNEPFEAGTDYYVKWWLKIEDPREDARAVITFYDRRGNDTTIVIEYFAIKLALRPDIDFGRLAVGESSTKTCWLVNESVKGTALIEDLKFQTTEGLVSSQGFTIVSPQLPLDLLAGDSVQVTVRFDATASGSYKDSIGVGDTCIFEYKNLVKATVGSPHISVSDYNYGDVAVGKMSGGQITIKNEGTTELIITGYTLPNQPNVFINELRDITESSPLKLQPNQTTNYGVTFAPPAEQTYIDSMVFFSNTDKIGTVDSVAILQGRGIKPDLMTNGYDWGRRRINKGPYDADNSYEVLKLINMGSQPVSITNVQVTALEGDKSAFEFDLSALNTTIGDSDSIYVPVRFNPKAIGPYHVQIAFVNSTQTVRYSDLYGIGINPNVQTVDVDFASTVVEDWTNPTRRTFRFINPPESEVAYGDTLRISALSFNSDIKDMNGTIDNSATGYGDKGFRFDMSQISFPIVIAQGEESAEFPAEFVAKAVPMANAQITTVSDATAEATSHWNGFGTLQGIELITSTVDICANETAQLMLTITNNGDDTLDVTKITFVTVLPEFKFVDSNQVTTTTTLPSGGKMSVPISFTPTEEGTYTTTIKVYNSSVKDPTVTVQLTANAFYYPLTAKINCAVAGRKLDIGGKAGFTLNLDAGDDPILAHVRDFDVVINNTAKFLKADSKDINLSQALSDNGWVIRGLNINDVAGRITFTVHNDTRDFRFPAGVELLSFAYGTYLPSTEETTSNITATINCNNPNCINIVTSGSDITVNPTCVFDLRKVVTSTGVTYFLGKVNPNPVQYKATINFAVSREAMTELTIYNSQMEEVLKPVSEQLPTGEYSVDVDATKLPSGVYWYKLVSGPFTQTEKMVIVK